MIAGPIRQLIKEFQRLPGVGEKTAFRLVMHVLESPQPQAQALADALVEIKQRIRPCSRCFQMTEEEVCAICASPKRDSSVICVVEDQASLMAIERARQFYGIYHVLGGRVSPMEGVGPGDLRIAELLKRIEGEGVKEVVVATNPNVEGEATALYLKRALEPYDVEITRIARGIPMGGDLEYSDALTLGRAFEGRMKY